MKLKFRHLLLLISLLLPVSLILAQEPATTLESLYIAFWPDYDDPSVLVLMTGALPADASLPAEVTVPLPPLAEINAVARVGEDGMADTQYQVEGDSLTLITSDPSFRVEFYVPYEKDGSMHSFDFTWDAVIDVEEFVAEIQQPMNATSLTTQPLAANAGTSPSDGLTYHALPAQVLPAGTPFEMAFSYDMANPGLTAGGSAPTAPSAAPATGNITAASSGINWLLVLAGAALLLLVIVVTWLVATRSGANGKARRSRKPRKPAPKERSAPAQFCHNCGTQSEKGDVFCRNCGTELK